MTKRGRPKKRDENAGATLETLRKLERDVLQKLVIDGIITVDQERAAREIDATWRAIMRGLFKTQRLETGSAAQRDPSDAMTEREAAIHAQRYIPWANIEAKAKISPACTRFELARRVCTLNQDPRAVGAEFAVCAASSVNAIRTTLDRYLAFMSVPLDIAKAG